MNWEALSSLESTELCPFLIERLLNWRSECHPEELVVPGHEKASSTRLAQ
jgi:hypothetical protein